MQKPKEKIVSPRKSGDWLAYLNDCLPGLVIPVGSRFQADVPEWTGPSNEANLNVDSDTSRWLGTRIWPLQHQNAQSDRERTGKGTQSEGQNTWKGTQLEGDKIGKETQSEGVEIGKGRPDSCKCHSPGSSQCVMLHVSQERQRLQLELGPAYKSWNFSEMGEEVSKSWTSKQKKKFESLVKANPLSQDKTFLGPAKLAFPSKTRKDIVSYYLNVHVPKRIGMMTRAGCEVFDSDDEEVEEAPTARNPAKRSRPTTTDSSPLAKSHYLTGRR